MLNQTSIYLSKLRDRIKISYVQTDAISEVRIKDGGN